MREKLASIQFLRFVAATLVVLFHTSIALEKYFPGGLSHAIVSNAVIGAAGIHIFFVISGFIMVHSSFESATGQFDQAKFAFRRFARIYPIYVVYAFVYLFFYSAVGAPKHLSTGE